MAYLPATETCALFSRFVLLPASEEYVEFIEKVTKDANLEAAWQSVDERTPPGTAKRRRKDLLKRTLEEGVHSAQTWINTVKNDCNPRILNETFVRRLGNDASPDRNDRAASMFQVMKGRHLIAKSLSMYLLLQDIRKLFKFHGINTLDAVLKKSHKDIKKLNEEFSDKYLGSLEP